MPRRRRRDYPDLFTSADIWQNFDTVDSPTLRGASTYNVPLEASERGHDGDYAGVYHNTARGFRLVLS
jgi:hypothetical protein